MLPTTGDQNLPPIQAYRPRKKNALAPEQSGGNVSYYVVEITDPKRLAPYTAECEDIIEALGMTFAEGCAFKAIWRSCAARTLGKRKAGLDESGIYDAEKAQYYGSRMVVQRKRDLDSRIDIPI